MNALAPDRLPSQPSPTECLPDTARITVTLNGEALQVAERSRLAELLAQAPATAALAADAYASAINGAFVARGLRGERVLQPGDAVTVFQAIVGG